MKNSLQHLFTYSLILFALSLALPSIAQDPAKGIPDDGPPTVIKEFKGGSVPPGEAGWGGDCHLINDGSDQNLDIHVFYTDPDFEACDLHIGYRLQGQPYEYVNVNITESEGYYSADMSIPFTAEEIEWRCENGISGFRIGLYCLVNGVYEAILPAPTDNTLNICCEKKDPPGDDEEGLPDPDGDSSVEGGGMKSNSDIDVFEFDKTKNLGVKGNNPSINTGFVDYFLYDLHGNPIKTLENISIDNSIQDLVSKLSIKTGIYFIRYLDNDKIQTKKVFKY